MSRSRLANRRRHEVHWFEFRGVSYTAGVSYFRDGALADVFIDCATGSSRAAHDALEMIEANYPNMPKIELDRRGPARSGWDAWWLEAEGADNPIGLFDL